MKIEISNGELVDRYTILCIKSFRIIDPKKVAAIRKNIDELAIPVEHLKIRFPDIITVIHDLQLINETLWDVENNIRGKEHRQEFDDQFIALARQVYIWNDERAKAKSLIDSLTGALGEIKQYTEYA